MKSHKIEELNIGGAWMHRFIAAVLLILCLTISTAWAQGFDRNLIGYYTSWSIYDRDYHVPDIPAEKITHINYAFANISDGRIALGDAYADIDRYYPGDSWEPGSLRGCFHQLQILKDSHPHLKTLISVGGWTWSTNFSDVALTPASRALFAASCVEFVVDYGFDGVDIDWEYPVSGGLPGNITRPEDRENFTLLLAELRTQLDGAGDYLLTIAAPAGPAIIANVEVELIHQYLDWINIMTYDFHGPWGGDGDPVTNFNSPLYMAADDPLDEPMHSSFNLSAAVQAYVDLGVPCAKINPGIPFYGRGFGSVSDINNGLFAPYVGVPWAGTWQNGVFDYWDLSANYIDLNGYTSYRHEEARVPWLFNPGAGIMISYDDPVSITEKGDFIRQQNLGGGMFWEFSADRNGILLDAAYEAILADPTGLPEALFPDGVRLLDNHPNPFNPETTIEFTLAESAWLRLSVHDVQGRLLKVLEEGRFSMGVHNSTWDGCNSADCTLASGVYLVVLEMDGVRQSKRLVLIK